MSFLAGYKWDAALVVAVGLSAAMFLLPRMVSIMMEGLAPLTDAARDFMNTRFPGRKFNIAMDYCMLLGDRDVITMEKLFQGFDCCGADTLHRPVDCDRPGTADHTDGYRRRI